jgi:hypothetical protein
MIVVIDPAVLLFDGQGGAPTRDEEKELEAAIDDLVRLCRGVDAVIPNVDWYWRPLQSELVRPLVRGAREPRLRQGLDALGRFARAVPLPALPTTGEIRMWGMRPLFAWGRLPAAWHEIMKRLLVGCVLLGEPVVLATRLFAGRNLVRHAVGRTTLAEKTRWRIMLHVPGCPPRAVPCVRSRRNVDVKWTTRFDERLPDGGHYPFCPPDRWWRRDVLAQRTFKSKPCWIDRFGSGGRSLAPAGTCTGTCSSRRLGSSRRSGCRRSTSSRGAPERRGRCPGRSIMSPRTGGRRFAAAGGPARAEWLLAGGWRGRGPRNWRGGRLYERPQELRRFDKR